MQLNCSLSFFHLLVLIWLSTLTSYCIAAEEGDKTLSVQAIMNMSLEELLQVEYISTSSLAPTSRNSSPSSLTIITHQDIENSGARRITDLLEIFVPNFQYILQGVIPWQIGSRGIMSNDKQLWLVNGKNILQRTSNGLSSELDIPNLSDINYIEVVRGPGSALHGPGALGMVFNIITFDHTSFNGFEAQTKVGIAERFNSIELKWGHSFSNSNGIFAYISAADMTGANHEHSPMYSGRETTFINSINNTQLNYGPTEDNALYGRNYREGYDGDIKWKGHLHYKSSQFDIWLRHVNGGEHQNNFEKQYQQTGYGHTNFNSTYKHDIGTKNTITVTMGWDNFWLQRHFFNTEQQRVTDRSYNEYEYNLKIQNKWTKSDSFIAVVGAEYRYEELGRKKNGLLALHGNGNEGWETRSPSVYGEINWIASDSFKLVAGARADQHTFTQNMFSPRMSLIFTPNRYDTYKIISSRSVRVNASNDMKIDMTNNTRKSDIETLRAIELAFDHLFSPDFKVGVDVFYHDWEPLSFNHEKLYRTLGGKIKSAGFEIDGEWKCQNTTIRASHSYTKLLEFNKIPGATFNHYSTAETGLGNDFTYWNNHSSKLFTTNKFGKWNYNASFVINWGSPGGYNFALTASDPDLGGDPGNYLLDDDRPFKPSIYLNLGAHYQASRNIKLKIDLHNVLGLSNENLNKRWSWNAGDYAGAHRIQPAALSLAAKYSFN